MNKSLAIEPSRFSLNTIKRGLPIFRMTLTSFYHDTKVRLLWGVAMLPLIASIIIRLYQTSLNLHDLFEVFDLVFLSLYVVWFSLVLGTAIIADEKENQAIAYLLVRPISREEIIFQKLLAYIAAMTVFYLIPVFGTYIALFSYSSSWFTSNLVGVIGFYGLTVLGSIVFGAIFLFVGVVFKRPLMIGMVIAIIGDYLFMFGPGTEKLAPSWHLSVIFDKLFNLPNINSALQSLAFIVGLTLVCVVGSMIFLKRQELL